MAHRTDDFPQKHKVVVVSNDAAQNLLLCEHLLKGGMQPISFTSAETALAGMDQDLPPDLIVTDIYMPGLDGWRFCRLLRSAEYARFNQVPVLVVSATYSGDEISRITSDVGANAFLTISLDGNEFIAQVQELLKGEKPQDILKVLIVEDSQLTSKRLVEAFQARGYLAEAAFTFQEGLTCLGRTAYDIAVLDYHLPDGLGDELLKALPEKSSGCVCIMMTADPQPELALTWMKMGAAAYLRKPCEPEYLISQCERARRERALLRIQEQLEVRSLQLQASEGKYRGLVQYSSDPIFTFNPDETYHFVNEAFARPFGKKPEEIIGKTPHAIFPHNEAEKRLTLVRRVFKTGEKGEIEVKVVRPTGEENYYLTLADPIKDDLGKVLYVTCISKDITERKQMEEALRQTNETAQAILNAVTESVFLMSADGKIIMVNETTAVRLGKRTADLVETDIYQYLPPDVAESRRKQVETVCGHGKTIRFEDERFGRWFENHIYPIFDADGKIRRVAIYGRDITERKRIEEALRESEERFRRVLQDVQTVSVQGYGPDGTTQYWNRASEQLYGYSAEEAIGQNLLNLIIPPEMRKDTAMAIQQMAMTGQPVPASELSLMRKDGSHVEVFSSHTIVQIPGREQELFCIDIDLSELKWAEKQVQASQMELERLLAESERSRLALLSLVEAQNEAEEQIRRLNAELEQHVADRTAQLTAANQELEAFSYSVSHDLRAPLRALDGFSAALIADYQEQLDEQGKNYLSRIQEASRRMGQLIEDMHNLARITRREMNLSQVDLSSVARQIAEELRFQTPERRLDFEISPHLTVRADPNLLKIALENLLRNAVKFSGKREVSLIQVGMREQDGERVYFVKDNGVGFNLEHAGNLFSPFHRLHSMQEFPGTGIGLSIVQRIIARHGGRIWPEAAENQGATFYFTLD